MNETERATADAILEQAGRTTRPEAVVVNDEKNSHGNLFVGDFMYGAWASIYAATYVSVRLINPETGLNVWEGIVKDREAAERVLMGYGRDDRIPFKS